MGVKRASRQVSAHFPPLLDSGFHRNAGVMQRSPREREYHHGNGRGIAQVEHIRGEEIRYGSRIQHSSEGGIPLWVKRLLAITQLRDDARECKRVGLELRLAKAAGDVGLGAPVRGVREEVCGGAELDQLPARLFV